MNDIIDFSEKRTIWLKYPERFAEDVLGIGKCKCGCKLDYFQVKALRLLARIVVAKYLKNVLNEIIPQELEEAYSKIGVSCQSGKGVGKTGLGAIACLWFLTVLKDSRVVLVGPKLDQIRKNLWAEISKWIMHSDNYFGGKSFLNHILEMLGLLLYVKKGKNDPTEKNKWVAYPLTFPKNTSIEQQKASIQGIHDKYLLFITDESSGIPEHIIDPIITTLTKEVNVILALFNPNKSKGWAIETQKDPQWYWLRINAEESSLVAKEYVEGLKKKWGIGSNKYRVSVLGLPPLQQDGGLISWEWIQNAKDRCEEMIVLPDEPIIAGIDVGAGRDLTIITIRFGMKVVRQIEINSSDSQIVAKQCSNYLFEYEPDRTFLDINGIGWALSGLLRHMGHQIVGVNVRNKSSDPNKFSMVRDEIYWDMRLSFELGIIGIPPKEEDLEGELSVLKYDDENGTGQIRMISKRDAAFKREMMDAVGYESPNRVDSLALTFYHKYESIQRSKRRKNEGAEFGMKNRIQNSSPYAWMGR